MKVLKIIFTAISLGTIIFGLMIWRALLDTTSFDSVAGGLSLYLYGIPLMIINLIFVIILLSQKVYRWMIAPAVATLLLLAIWLLA